MGLMGFVARLAAANNAEWCDLVCRTHAIEGRFDKDAWASPIRTPPFYPDAVTLVSDVSAPDLLARIDTSPGCSIKDSFASLDLTSFGFTVLFDAEWIVRRAPTGQPPSTGLHWDVVPDPVSFVLWERGSPIDIQSQQNKDMAGEAKCQLRHLSLETRENLAGQSRAFCYCNRVSTR